jgi:hypothetical protein
VRPRQRALQAEAERQAAEEAARKAAAEAEQAAATRWWFLVAGGAGKTAWLRFAGKVHDCIPTRVGPIASASQRFVAPCQARGAGHFPFNARRALSAA